MNDFYIRLRMFSGWSGRVGGQRHVRRGVDDFGDFDMSGSSMSVSKVAVSLVFGSIGLLILGVQPLLYGSYVMERTITESQLGLLGAIEAMTIALGSGIAIPLLRRLVEGWVAIGGIALLCVGNMVAVHEGQIIILFCVRALAGVGGGLLVGVAAASIARTKRVGGWAGAFLLIQAAGQFAVMQGFALLFPDAGSWAVQMALIGIAIASIPLIPFLPRGLSHHSTNETKILRPDGAGVVGLVMMLLFVGAVVTIWAYAGLWLQGNGVSARSATQLLTIGLAGQMLGAVKATIIGDGRRAWLRVLALAMLLVVVLGIWLNHPESAVLSFAFGFFWMATVPALSSVLIELDQQRRAVPFAAAAQLAGVAIVPTILGAAFGNGNLDRIVVGGMCVIAASCALLLGQLPRFLRRTQPV